VRAGPSPTALIEPAALVMKPTVSASDFGALYNQWFDAVHRWVRAFGGPAADIEDLTQEVFVVVQRKLARFDGQNVGGWLYAITRRTVSDYRRRWWFRRIFMRPRSVSLEAIEQHGSTSEQVLDRKQQQARFYRLVDKMNPKWRDSFVLFEVLGYSGDEIAALREVPSATIRTHLHRARKEFMDLLAKELES
jgi:RNA polymerase sigma-70 factor (ECF subfamily)